MVESVCVAGAGTMGSGISLVAAQAGFPVVLFDLDQDVLERAMESIEKNILHQVERSKISAADGSLFFNRIQFTADPQKCSADLFIEAIVEDLPSKIQLFNQFAAFNSEEAIFATNTSSLSISTIQAGVVRPERVIGMHFFNPAPVMKLVEVISGKQTSEITLQIIDALCIRMGKTPVHCTDVPGFIVNRVARQYYLEALKLVEEGMADIATVDQLLESAGFKMGPFKLMDLIGMDVNLAVTERLYKDLGGERLKPSKLQQQKVAAGELGRKSGRGFYTYTS